MTGVLAALCAMTVIGGLVLAIAAWRDAIPHATRSASSTSLWTRAVDRARRVRRTTWLSLGFGLLLGLAATYWLRWPTLLIIVPAAVVGMPRLLADPPQQNLQLLEALDRWVRGMLAQLSTGKSITDALRLSARQPVPQLAEPLNNLVKRLDDRWTTAHALQAMADELASPDADAVLAALILSSSRGGTGASVTLYALADSIHEQLRALREIEAERSKPRVVVRQVTLISAVALVLFVLLTPGFFQPYSTPLGQLLLMLWLTLYVLSVWFMRRMTLARPRERILRSLS